MILNELIKIMETTAKKSQVPCVFHTRDQVFHMYSTLFLLFFRGCFIEQLNIVASSCELHF